MTGYSAERDRRPTVGPGAGHVHPETAVIFRRKERSPSSGIPGHDGGIQAGANDSGIVKIDHVPPETAVTFARKLRSRSFGMRGHVRPERPVTLLRKPRSTSSGIPKSLPSLGWRPAGVCSSGPAALGRHRKFRRAWSPTPTLPPGLEPEPPLDAQPHSPRTAMFSGIKAAAIGQNYLD